ncbi:MAG: efflux RND transporter permease subunit, partial [Holophagales bacterium]|nr:efflux RND transporter permease subunit [Holophagales bacterium]
MGRLVELALAKRSTVFFLLAALLLMGSVAYNTLPREKYPDIQVPVIVVSVAYPGAAPPEVEKQITQPLEREAMGLDGLKKLRSISSEGLALVTAEFVTGYDLDTALQKVRDRVDLAKVDFPEEAEEPVLTEVSFSQVPVLQVSLAGDVGPVVLEELAEDLQDEIETLPGVLRTDLVGAVQREVQVNVDPRKLRVYGLSLDDVVDAVGDENVSIPGGDLRLGDVSYAVRVPGEVTDPLEVADFVIDAPGGRSISVRDVAEVRFGFEDRTSYARIDGQEAVALLVQKRTGANIIEVVDEVKSLVQRVEPGWPAGVNAIFLADQSVQIHLQVRDLENSILSGLFLVLLVLMFALGLRNALFVALSIPFSMLLAVLVLQAIGVTLNMVVLFALVLAVGMLVDNAVVVIENIFRHMQEGMPRMEAARVATQEVGDAIAVSTLTTVGAFAPLFFWPGVMGDFMKYLPLTVSVALLASLVVAFTINPVLCSVLMRVAPGKRSDSAGDGTSSEAGGDSGWTHRLGGAVSRRYRRLLESSLDHKILTLGLTLAVAAAIAVAFVVANPGVQFVAEEQPNQIKVDITMPPGTHLDKTDAVARQLEERLSALPDLRLIAANVGQDSQTDEFGGGDSAPHLARLTLDLVERQQRSQSSLITLDQARELAGSVPGAVLDISRLGDGLGTGPAVAFEITGADFEVLG